MQTLLPVASRPVRHLVTPRADLLLENLALRQQLAVVAAKSNRPRLGARDGVLWVALGRLWPVPSQVRVRSFGKAQPTVDIKPPQMQSGRHQAPRNAVLVTASPAERSALDQKRSLNAAKRRFQV